MDPNCPMPIKLEALNVTLTDYFMARSLVPVIDKVIQQQGFVTDIPRETFAEAAQKTVQELEWRAIYQIRRIAEQSE